MGLIIFTSQVSFWLQITLKSWRCDVCSHVFSHLDVVGLKQLSVSGNKNTSVYILIHSYTHKHTDCFLDDWTLNLILYLGKNLWSWASRELKLADFWMEFGVREQTTHSCMITHTHSDTSNHEAASCCPGNAASSGLVGICGSVMGTRLPGERGGGDSELNLPAPLAQFLSQQRGGGVWRWVCEAGGSETFRRVESCFVKTLGNWLRRSEAADQYRLVVKVNSYILTTTLKKVTVIDRETMNQQT